MEELVAVVERAMIQCQLHTSFGVVAVAVVAPQRKVDRQ